MVLASEENELEKENNGQDILRILVSAISSNSDQLL